ncbi:hypothetical protein [Aneurinibacillus thermoaerophilus]|uniref:hypothetical protein n=1 Tax=Aneurinibacillus thermoaerophilus TaxID=143495 RepID=UPI002E229EDB|nr:hypothetical protein [Aneurinibacillus thermoaerophilus]
MSGTRKTCRKANHPTISSKKKVEVENRKDGKCVTTREEVIQFGIKYLEGIGSSYICQVCISHGGSCCLDCRHLKYGKGCQQRNISCTAWLCGFLKFIFYEAGLLQEWNQFWDQIPGQDFRKDHTPPVFVIQTWLEVPNVQLLSQAFAQDLTDLVKKNDNPYYISELNNEIDWYVTRSFSYHDPEVLRVVRKKLKKITRDFRHFQSAKER